MIDQTRLYQPDTVSAPGAIIADLLEERGLTQGDLAERMGRSEKLINQLVNGKAAITSETAYQLEMVLGTPARYWLTHEAHYRAFRVQQAEEALYPQWYAWLDEMPIKELKKLGMLSNLRKQGSNKNLLVRETLRFFGVASPDEWRAVYLQGNLARARWRVQAERSDPFATAVWMRLGELQAEAALPSTRYHAAGFAAAAPALRALTVETPEVFMPKLIAMCAESGVVVTVVPAIPGACASGAARWFNGHPMIQLSLYGKYNDRFWFTFFHEMAHIMKHEPRILFLDEWDPGELSAEEREADQFAADSLIPPTRALELRSLHSEADVLAFAGSVGVHPGIVVGRLQHDKVIDFSHLNRLKQKFIWSGDASV